VDLREVRPAGEGTGESGEGVVVGDAVPEVGEEFVELVGEVVGRALLAIALEGECGLAVGARRAADAEVDAVRIHPGEHGEGLGDFQRAVVREHDPTGPDAEAGGGGRDGGDEDFGRGAREAGRGVVFGDPVAVVAEGVGESRQVDGVAQGVPAGRAFGDGGLIEDAESEHRGHL